MDEFNNTRLFEDACRACFHNATRGLEKGYCDDCGATNWDKAIEWCKNWSCYVRAGD